ncbi:MAG: hypothetical protein K0R02_60 [Rickettsiaceae bacterium]|jgi:lysophospholipid acyltransferase (LPLAT)-like uncharacterized protein|nr:hypothetical protein [Rickettsiaceae bacterium]
MLKRAKKFLLNNILLRIILAFSLMLYLRFVYWTTKWKFISPDGHSTKVPDCRQTILITWHNRLAIMPFMAKGMKKFYALASNHPDGMIIAWILRFFLLKVIKGSTNRNAFLALKQIIKVLKDGGNIGITPDGPKGPVYKINSNLVSAAKLSNAEIIVTGCYISKFKELKSWDSFIFPLPFAKCTIVIDQAITVTKDMDGEELNIMLENKMNLLNEIAKKLTV